MSEVFELVKRTPELVVIKVKADDNLTIALHPYINATYDYISVTRGKEHILTIIKKDGKTCSFHWGESGYTLISDNLEMLRKKVVEFIEDECHILLGWKDSKPSEATIFYNSNFGEWQLTLYGKDGTAHYWSKTANSFEEMRDETADMIIRPVYDWYIKEPTGRKNMDVHQVMWKE